MTDNQKLLIALFAHETPRGRRGVTVDEVVTMLYELGAEYRQRASELVLTTA